MLVLIALSTSTKRLLASSLMSIVTSAVSVSSTFRTDVRDSGMSGDGVHRHINICRACGKEGQHISFITAFLYVGLICIIVNLHIR